ncbi:unnamed protein product, partial [Adineta steineri]
MYFIHLSPSHDGVLGQSSSNAHLGSIGQLGSVGQFGSVGQSGSIGQSVLECLEWDISSKKVIFGRENKTAGNDDNSLNLTNSTLDINRHTGEIAVLDDNNRRIIIFNSSNSSKLITILFDSSNSTISNVPPSTFAYDRNYTMYVLDGVNKEIVRMNNPLEFGKNSTKIFDWSSYSQQIGVPPAGGLCIDNTDDNIFINDGHQIFLYDQSISILSSYVGNAAAGNATEEFNNPTSIVIDNYQRLFVNDVGNNRIQMFEVNSQHGITLQTNISNATGLSLYLPDILVINTNTAVYLYNLTDNITTCAIGCNTTELNNIHNALIDNEGNIIVTESNAVVLYPIIQQCFDITTDSTITTTMSTTTITTSMTSTNQFTNVTIQSTTTTPQSTTTITTATTSDQYTTTTTASSTTASSTTASSTTASSTTENPTTEDPTTASSTTTITIAASSTTMITTTTTTTTENPTTTATTTASPTTENPTTKTTTAASSTTTITTAASSTIMTTTTTTTTTENPTTENPTTKTTTDASSTTTITTAVSSTTTITTTASPTTENPTTKTTTAASSTTTITTAASSTIMTTITASTTTTTTTTIVQPNFNPINNCTSGSFGINCMFTDSICNTTQLCLNNGSCIENKTVENGYSCDCLEGFEGIDCQDDERLCKPFTCFDRGNCTNISSIDFKCTCDDGYQGKNCEITVDLCNNVTCQNGGVCFQTYLNYTCQCLSGYKGLHCEIAETSAIIRTYVAKSFGYIAILMLCGLIGFLVILDALKYIFGIDPAKSQ